MQGNATVLQEIEVKAAEVDDQVKVSTPKHTELLAAYPNPFNPMTKISYNLSTDAVVNLSVYNITGQEVQRIITNEFRSAGVYRTTWNGQDAFGTVIPSGTYIIVLKAGDVVQSKKVVFIK
jgi:flagellar hook assembly protein FlgD